MKINWTAGLLALDVVHVAVGGLLYLLRQQAMPYHEVVLGSAWAEVPPGTQALVLGLMRVVGGSGLVVAGFAAALLAGPARRGERWALTVVTAGLVALHLVQLWVISGVAAASGAEPPWQPAAAGLVVVLVAGMSGALHRPPEDRPRPG